MTTVVVKETNVHTTHTHSLYFEQTPYRILCNGTEQKSSESRARLNSALARCTPLHKIRYGVSFPSYHPNISRYSNPAVSIPDA